MFVRVTFVPNEFEGNLVCALLRAEGIDCFARETGLGGPHEVVVVHDEDLERAREVVAARD
jgi:Putative prokaryotic signal transducing protein